MTTSRPSSFQPRQVGRFIKLKGTKISHHNAQLLVSTGVPSLDNICGGGVPVGSIFLIEEDKYGKYSKLLLKYFFAEGVVCEHDLFVASGNIQPKQLIKELPGLIDEPVNIEKLTINNGESSEKMKIAWRYQKLDSVKSTIENSSFGHYYDLSQALKSDLIEKIKITEFDAMKELDDDLKTSSILNNLLVSVQDVIEKGNFKPEALKTDTNEDSSILRIGINSLGSPHWSSKNYEEYINLLPLFLLRLKALMRASCAISFVTVPVGLLNSFEGNGCIRKLEQIADNVIHLESFMGSNKEKNPLYKDYHGLFHIKKFAKINSLCCYVPPSFDLAFKLRKKSFAIEILHLPPDLSETVNRSQTNTPAAKSCTAATQQGFDF